MPRSISAIRDRLSQASGGGQRPWMLNGPHLVREVLPTDESLSHQVPIAAIASLRREDGVFIENAPSDIAFLLRCLTEIERYQEALALVPTGTVAEIASHLQNILNRTD